MTQHHLPVAHDGHGEKITVRIPDEMRSRIEVQMQKQGIMKMSDFTRQALVKELDRLDAEQSAAEALAIFKLELEKKALLHSAIKE